MCMGDLPSSIRRTLHTLHLWLSSTSRLVPDAALFTLSRVLCLYNISELDSDETRNDKGQNRDSESDFEAWLGSVVSLWGKRFRAQAQAQEPPRQLTIQLRSRSKDRYTRTRKPSTQCNQGLPMRE
jgi:hypothetical protein